MRVGIQAGFGRPPEFHSAAAGARIWREMVRDHLTEDGDLEGAGWPKHIVYTAELRRRADGSRLLWFSGQC